MPFSSRACGICKQRRVKCDETYPLCKRCEKANLNCDGVQENPGFIFLNENEYVVGKRNRPRGPNVKTARLVLTKRNPKIASKGNPGSVLIASSSKDTLVIEEPPPIERQSIPRALDTPLGDQALVYFSRSYIELPPNLPEISDGYLKYIFLDESFSQPQSLLNLSLQAVSYATFGRARKCRSAQVIGSKKYSQALIQMNLAVRDENGAINNRLLLAAMLLSFYENSSMNKLESPSRDCRIQSIAARSFTHHDGAMALLHLRRQQLELHGYPDCDLELDKLIRRQIIRLLLIRSLPVPPWLRDGSKFGEEGFALELDRSIVIAAKLRYQASLLFVSVERDPTTISIAESKRYNDKLTKHRRHLLAEAQALDRVLLLWTINLPKMESQYTVHTVFEEDDRSTEIYKNTIFDNANVHIYPSVGHAGMWSRYRVVRLAINDIILKSLSLVDPLNSNQETDVLPFNEVATTTKLIIKQLANDFCASIPYTLGLIRVENSDLATANGKPDLIVTVNRDPASLQNRLASAACFLCWPLAMAKTISEIPERQKQYLRAQLLEVSAIVNDGMLERVATGSWLSARGE